MAKARRIAITGAGGFVGGWLMAALEGKARTGAVEVLPLTATGQTGRAIDIAERESVFAMVEALRPDVVVHLAAIAAPADARRDPDHAWRVNVDGTRHLAQAMLRHAPNGRLVFAGSSEAYGAAFNADDGLVDEGAALQPLSAYGATKAAADIVLGQIAHEGLDIIRFRPFNHTGPGQSPDYVVPAFASQIAAIVRGEREPVVDVGNLDAVRDFLDVRDVVRAYAMACEPDLHLPPGVAINLASGTGRAIGAILDLLIEQAGQPIAVRIDPARLRPSEVPRAVGNPGRAAKLLGWSAAISFEQTAADVLNHCLKKRR